MAGKKSDQFGTFLCEGLERSSLSDKRVLRALSRVPRHEFVADEFKSYAYEDRALPIGHGQTISQPYIVALMSQEAKIGEGSKVLEVGTGCGYQAAVLAELGADVFSIEIVEPLAMFARETLNRLGYQSVNLRVGDGWAGWKEEAPFDAILITAAAPEAPARLLTQLKDGGRMLVPVESSEDEGEVLLCIQRIGEDFSTKSLGPVRFVPMTGDARGKKHHTNGTSHGSATEIHQPRAADEIEVLESDDEDD